MRKKIWRIIALVPMLWITSLCLDYTTYERSLFGVLISLACVAICVKLVVSIFKKAAAVQDELPMMTKDKEQHYEEIGMSASEIELFRDTMNSTKKQIMRLQDNMTHNAKLKAIDLRHDTVRVSKAMFKELVKEPTKLPDASHFLYTHLPNLVDLTDKYIEINNHEIKNKDTYGKLDESAQIIDQIARLIIQDYHSFVADDLDDMDVELSIAKQSLKRDNKNSI